MTDSTAQSPALSDDEMSSEDLAQLYALTLKDVEEGQILKGRIIAKGPTEILVDVGYKSEGTIALAEFPDPAALQVGDEIDVYLETKEDENGMVVLSKRKADKVQGWERIIAEHKEGDVIEGRPTRKVKGGLMVDVGIEAFLPASLASLRGYANLDSLVGQTLKFIIVKISKARKNIVLSRRDFLLREKEEVKGKLLETLKVGERRTGTVKNITDFGAFIDLGGLDGLLHIADMSWSRISHPSEIVSVGQKIEIVVLGFDKETTKISLGLKQIQPSPWAHVAEKYPVGARVKGRVVNLMPYGAFVEVEKGIEGLVHVSELSWTKRISHPSEVVTVGQEVEAVVLSADPANQRLSLGIRQTSANPWQEVVTKYPVGAQVTGKVKHLTDYGAFVELEEGVEALLHNADISWTRKVSHPSELLKKGKPIEAVIISCDPEARRIAVSMKQLIPDPWPEFQQRFHIDALVDGRVTKVATFGIFVELDKDLEGLAHISELDVATGTKIEDRFKVGDPVTVRVIRMDDAERKIGLSMKSLL